MGGHKETRPDHHLARDMARDIPLLRSPKTIDWTAYLGLKALEDGPNADGVRRPRAGAWDKAVVITVCKAASMLYWGSLFVCRDGVTINGRTQLLAISNHEQIAPLGLCGDRDTGWWAMLGAGDSEAARRQGLVGVQALPDRLC